MKEFPFGAAFFMPSKDIANDLTNMKLANMNVARLEWIKNAVWEAVEQSPQVYTFDALDEAMDAAVAAGVEIILQVGIYPPRWVRETYGEEGVINDRGQIPYPYELFSFCYDNPKVFKLAERFIRTMVQRYRNHPALYGWITWNEPHVSNGDITCYCKYTVMAFRKWLSMKYGSLDDLNKAWNEGYPSYFSWEDVEPPRQRPRSRGIYQAWQDWRTFMELNFAQLIRKVTDVIREEDKAHPTKVNLLIPIINTTVSCANVWSMANTADEIGVSLFVEINEGDYPQLISQSADLIRSAVTYTKGRFWLDEIQGGPNFVSHGRPLLPTNNLIYLYPWQAIAHGAKGFTYWMWRSLHKGLEAGEFGLVGRDGSLRPRTMQAAKAGEIINRYSDLILNSEPKNKVCILHSPAIFHLLYGEGLDTHTGSFPLYGNNKPKSRYTSAIMGAYTLLWEEKFGVDFISPEWILNGGLDKYSALVMPFPYLMDQKTGEVIEKFIEAGGLLISEFPNIMKDESGFLYDVSPGAGLQRAFGYKEFDISQAVGKINVTDAQTNIAVGQVRQIVTLEPGSSILGRFADGNPAIIFNRFGLGGVLSFCTEVFSSVMWEEHDALSSLIGTILHTFGLKKSGELLDVESNLSKRVEISELFSLDGRIVIVNNHNDSAVIGKLYLDNCCKCVNLETGKELLLERGVLPLNLAQRSTLVLYCIGNVEHHSL